VPKVDFAAGYNHFGITPLFGTKGEVIVVGLIGLD